MLRTSSGPRSVTLLGARWPRTRGRGGGIPVRDETADAGSRGVRPQRATPARAGARPWLTVTRDGRSEPERRRGLSHTAAHGAVGVGSARIIVHLPPRRAATGRLRVCVALLCFDFSRGRGSTHTLRVTCLRVGSVHSQSTLSCIMFFDTLPNLPFTRVEDSEQCRKTSGKLLP